MPDARLKYRCKHNWKKIGSPHFGIKWCRQCGTLATKFNSYDEIRYLRPKLLVNMRNSDR